MGGEVIIKLNFEEVVSENMIWMLKYIKTKIKNPCIAEDIVQAALLKAYKAYDNYYEEGKLKYWLLRILQNTLKSYYGNFSASNVISLDYSDEETKEKYEYIFKEITPEEEYINKELIQEILKTAENLSEKQKKIFNFRYIFGFSIDETAEKLQIPIGSVKSGSYSAVNKIRTSLGINYEKNKRRCKGMNCDEIRKYLFLYAKGLLSKDMRENIKEHLEKCKECSNMEYALEKLIPNMTFAKEDEKSHFIIQFPDKKISYVGVLAQIPNFEEANKVLKENNYKVPQGEHWLDSGFSRCNELVLMADNEGNEIKFEIYKENQDIVRVHATGIKKIYQFMWIYDTYIEKNTSNSIKKSLEAPNLYYGSMNNCMGEAVKSAIYQAVKGNAENIRIKRGNGVIDCGTYKFPYADRYVTDEESVSLDFSFLMNE